MDSQSAEQALKELFPYLEDLEPVALHRDQPQASHGTPVAWTQWTPDADRRRAVRTAPAGAAAHQCRYRFASCTTLGHIFFPRRLAHHSLRRDTGRTRLCPGLQASTRDS